MSWSIRFLLTLIGLLLPVSFLALVLFPIDLGATDLLNRLELPSVFGISDSGHLLGCDYLGRDLGIHLLYVVRASVRRTPMRNFLHWTSVSRSPRGSAA